MPLKIMTVVVVVVVKKKKKKEEEEEEVGHIDRHHSNQQPCGGQCPVFLEPVWYTHAKGA
jgi:hypothetical protein